MIITEHKSRKRQKVRKTALDSTTSSYAIWRRRFIIIKIYGPKNSRTLVELSLLQRRRFIIESVQIWSLGNFAAIAQAVWGRQSVETRAARFAYYWPKN